jgi:hypothetical protein
MKHGYALKLDGRAGAQATVDRGEHCLRCQQLTNVWSYCRGKARRGVLSPAVYARQPVRDAFAAAATRELSRPQRERAARLRVNARHELTVEFAASPSGNQAETQVSEMHCAAVRNIFNDRASSSHQELSIARGDFVKIARSSLTGVGAGVVSF